MSQTVIPLQFEQYLQEKINAGYGPDMNEMIFAYIPGLDLAAPIDRATGLPDPSTWVHQQDVDQVGKVGESALAYSVVIASSEPAFTFNAIYLHDKYVPNSCGVIVHKISETKEEGMSSTKSLLQAYSGAATIAGISVDAATWQIDYQARLTGIDEDHRLSSLDMYGELAVVDGFDFTYTASTKKCKFTAGVAYVGGLRAITEDEITLTISSKPNVVYIDAYRDGSALSSHINNVALFASNTAQGDYIDASGKAHYVAKLITFNADGSITDHRKEQNGALERTDNAATNADIDNESTEKKHINLEQFWRGLDKKIKALTLQLEKERVSIGEIIEITGTSQNPATLKGYGTWSAFGAGLVIVGVGSYKDSRNETKTWTDGQKFGEYQHVQTEAELARHDHTDNFDVQIEEDGEHVHETDVNNSDSGQGKAQSASGGDQGNLNTKPAGLHTHEAEITGKVLDAGSSAAMNITQPSIAVYRWKRVA